ncbi:tyrosine-type recombinase/integrase [Pseudomonas caspiana]
MASITQLPPSKKSKKGRWRVLIRIKGFYRSESFDTKDSAKKWAALEEAKINEIRATGSATVDKAFTLKFFIDDYIKFADAIAPLGRSKRASLLALGEVLGKYPMVSVTEKILTDYANSRLIKDKVKGATIAVDLSSLAAVFKHVKKVHGYSVDPRTCYAARSYVDDLVGIDGEERERTIQPHELDEIFKAYAAKKRGFIPMPDLITFAIATCMRQEEICKIKIEDLDVAGKTVRIRDRKDPKKKDSNDSVIPLFPIAMDIALKHIGSRKSGRVFPYNSRSVSASFTRIVADLKIDDLHFHDLRHTAITALFELGLSIEQVALLSGHKDWKMLKRYTHIKASHLHTVYDKLLAAHEADKARQANNVTSSVAGEGA